jgi:hypothetical protein
MRWLNQIEIYFSVVQRKVLTPDCFATRATLEHYLLAFQNRYQAMVQPARPLPGRTCNGSSSTSP